MMFNIASYLEKFKKVGEKRNSLEHTVSEVFKNVAGVDIDKSSVKISKGEMTVSATPMAHSMIFMKREQIISVLKEKLPDISIDRIRCR